MDNRKTGKKIAGLTISSPKVVKIIFLQRFLQTFRFFLTISQVSSQDFLLFFSPDLQCAFSTQKQHHITISPSASAERNNFSTQERSLVPAVSNDVHTVYTHASRTQKTTPFSCLTGGLQSISGIVHYITLSVTSVSLSVRPPSSIIWRMWSDI